MGGGKSSGLKAEVAGMFGGSLQCVGGGFNIAMGCKWVKEKTMPGLRAEMGGFKRKARG